MNLAWRRKRSRQCQATALIGVVGALIVLAATAATAGAVTLRASVNQDDAFDGNGGCGDQDRVTVQLPRGSRSIKPIRPYVGRRLSDPDKEGPVATVASIGVVHRTVIWTAVAGGSLCRNANDPACDPTFGDLDCSTGWGTNVLTFSVRFKKNFHRAYIECTNRAGLRYHRVQHPSSCPHFGTDGSNAGGVVLRQLHWRKWGRAVARAHGIECGFHLPCANLPARVRVYRRKVRCGKLAYTRLKSRTRYGSVTIHLSGCPGETS